MLSLKNLKRLDDLHLSRQTTAQRAVQIAAQKIAQLQQEIENKKKEILEVDMSRELAWKKIEQIISREKMLRVVQGDANLVQTKINLEIEIEQIIDAIKNLQLSKGDAQYRVNQAMRKQNSVDHLRRQVKKKLSSEFLAMEELNTEEIIYGRSN